MSRRNLCRRKYEELSGQFFAHIGDICQRYQYSKADIDRSMKRLLKIAEFRDPTPNDVSRSTSQANINKEHLDYFFNLFRNLVQHTPEDIALDDEADSPSSLSSDSKVLSLPETVLSDSDVTTGDQDDSFSSDVEEEQYEVERIISRTVNANGKYVYHIKWAGYETSSDPENFVDEENMNCPDLIEKFEREERLRKKERAKKLEEKAAMAKKRKLEAEQRAKDSFASTSPRDISRNNTIKKSCKEINLCSSTSASEEEDNHGQHLKHIGHGRDRDFGRHKSTVRSWGSSSREPENGSVKNHRESFLSSTTNKDCSRRNCGHDWHVYESSIVLLKKKKTKHKASINTQRRIITSSSSVSQYDEARNIDSLEQDGNYAFALNAKHINPYIERGQLLTKKDSSRTKKSHPSSNGNRIAGLKSRFAKTVLPDENEIYSEVEKQSQLEHSVCGTEEKLDERINNNQDCDDDPYGGFRYIMREADGFQKGFKAVKVSIVTEHPVTNKVVAVVVFADPASGHEFAQYISLKETNMFAPMELRQYFLAAKCADPKNLALSLLLHNKTNE